VTSTPTAAAYQSREYIDALREVGSSVALPMSGGTLLRRAIGNTGDHDAIGPYPLLCCDRWRDLNRDLGDLEGLVSVAAVADPFGDHDATLLRECFPDVCFAFKEHFIADLEVPPGVRISKHHRRNAARALRYTEVTEERYPKELRDDWVRIYGFLVNRHRIRGVAAFSAASLERQLDVPGLLAVTARREDRVVGMVLWYLRGDVAYYHLGAYDDEGYSGKASFAVFWRSMELLAERSIRYVGLGGGAGVESDASDGLARFKRGWATSTRPAYFCGRVLQPERYRELTRKAGMHKAAFFPAYRGDERN
jgi:hypothetical protein